MKSLKFASLFAATLALISFTAPLAFSQTYTNGTTSTTGTTSSTGKAGQKGAAVTVSYGAGY